MGTTMTTTKYIGRFEKDLASIQLDLVQPCHRQNNDDDNADYNDDESSQRRIVSIQHLEDSLEECLNYDDDDDDPDGPVVQYPLQADASWLHCRRSKKSNATLLGLQEEDDDVEEQEEEPESEHSVSPATTTSSMVEICTFVARSNDTSGNGDSNGDNSKSYCLPGPRSDWRRDEQQQQSQSEPPTPRQLVHWVDLLPFTSKNVSSSNGDKYKHTENWLPTLGSIVHFLRSLLDTDHSSSPWSGRTMKSTSSNDHNSGDSSSSNSTRPDCVLLLVHQLPERFHEVRVSDVCPSWYVHSICQVRVPVPIDAGAAESGSPLFPWDQPAPFPSQSTSTVATTVATLVVYRRLAPRDHLSVHHPVHDQPATAGCLWEIFTPVVPEQQEGEPQLQHPVTLQQQQQHQYDARMVAPPYVSTYDEYPGLVEPLSEPTNFNTLRTEAMAIQHWTAWPESQHYRAKSSNDDNTAGAPWNVFPLCHCFPASDVSHRQWIPMTCALVPKTVALLKTVLGDTLRTALFSRLDPHAVLEAHTGWEDLANHVVRLHIPLVVPAEGDLCGTWVDGCVETHAEGRPLCFDDSKTHRAFNYSGQDRIVLILDLARPAALPKGTATGGHSEELDQFIEKMGLGGN